MEKIVQAATQDPEKFGHLVERIQPTGKGRRCIPGTEDRLGG